MFSFLKTESKLTDKEEKDLSADFAVTVQTLIDQMEQLETLSIKVGFEKEAKAQKNKLTEDLEKVCKRVIQYRSKFKNNEALKSIELDYSVLANNFNNLITGFAKPESGDPEVGKVYFKFKTAQKWLKNVQPDYTEFFEKVGKTLPRKNS